MFNRRPSRAGAIIGSVHREPCADKQRVKGRTAPPVFFLPGRDFERDRKDELRPATLRVITWSAEPYPLLHSRSGDRRPPLPLLAESLVAATARRRRAGGPRSAF